MTEHTCNSRECASCLSKREVVLLTEFKGLLPRRLLVFPVLFLALFMSASILVDFSRLFKVFHLEEATLRVHQSSFFRLKRKLFV